MGAPAPAALEVVVFSDYQCPYCADADRALRSLREKYPKRLAVTVHHYPARSHPLAELAARGQVCARATGHGEQFHNLMFDSAFVLRKERFASYARVVGIADTGAFRACLESPSISNALAADASLAARLGVGLTPTLLVGQRVYDGVPSDLVRIVEEALRHAPSYIQQ